MSNNQHPETSDIHAQVTPALKEKVEQLAKKRGKNTSASDVIRDAIRAYIDQQEDVIGSRANFQKSFRERI